MKLGVAGRSLLRPVLALVVLATTAGCPPQPPAVPPNDADAAPGPFDAAGLDASLAARRSCVNLRLLGCPEGRADSVGRCEAVVDKVLEAGPGFALYDPGCVADSLTVEAVRRCPMIACEQTKAK